MKDLFNINTENLSVAIVSWMLNPHVAVLANIETSLGDSAIDDGVAVDWHTSFRPFDEDREDEVKLTFEKLRLCLYTGPEVDAEDDYLYMTPKTMKKRFKKFLLKNADINAAVSTFNKRVEERISKEQSDDAAIGAKALMEDLAKIVEETNTNIETLIKASWPTAPDLAKAYIEWEYDTTDIPAYLPLQDI